MLAYAATRAPRAIGLENTGATCYFNSLLQALVGCSALGERTEKHAAFLGKTATGAAVLDFFRASAGTGPVGGHSNRILQALKGDLEERRPKVRFGNGQESASEALVHLLDMMEPAKGSAAPQADDRNAIPQSLDSPVTELFTHAIDCSIRCHACKKTVSVRRDYGVSINLFHLVDAKKRPSTPREFADTLLRNKTEVSYRCPECGKGTSGTRTYDLRLVPEIIVASLNRYDGPFGHGNRDAVYFPESFTLPSHLPGQSMTYRLVAQVEHSGTLSGGHYWARALRADGKVWTLNDMSVSPGATFAPCGETYLLVYNYTGLAPTSSVKDGARESGSGEGAGAPPQDSQAPPAIPTQGSPGVPPAVPALGGAGGPSTLPARDAPGAQPTNPVLIEPTPAGPVAVSSCGAHWASHAY